jgi:hypothetical protein
MQFRPARVHERGSGPGRSRVFFSGLFATTALAVLLAVVPRAQAQLEVLLRGLDPVVPRVGARATYRFEAREPAGHRILTFDARIERIAPGPDGSVTLRFTSGDSLDARVEVAPALFAGRGGSLLDHVRSIVEVAGRDTTRWRAEDWASLPGFDRAPPLPGSRDSVLAPQTLTVAGRRLECRGRSLHEASRQVKPLGAATMTQSAVRDVESWTHPDAPILGVVRAQAVIRSERSLSKPIAGVPESGPRIWNYRLELVKMPGRNKPATPGRGH